MRTRSTFLGLALAVAALPAAVARAQELPPGYGVVTPSGSVFTTQISKFGDADDYVLRGYPGTILTVVVKPSKPVLPDQPLALEPELQFIRPGGDLANDEDGFVVARKGTALSGTMALDSPGWWKVRVRGRNLAIEGATPNYSFGGYSVQVTYRPAPQPVLPIVTKSFSKTGAISNKADADDFAFEGYPGQTVAVTVKLAKGSALFPGVSLIRPDGGVEPTAEIVPFGGKTTTLKATIPAPTPDTSDTQGTWRVRVVGLDPATPPDPKNNTTGGYSIAVKLGKPPVAPSIRPDANGQYRFTVSGVGGATIGFTLKFAGEAPTVVGFTDPAGAAVPGFSVPPAAGGVLKLANYRIPDKLPIGSYRLTLSAPAVPPTNVTFSSTLVAPKSSKARKVTFDAAEPAALGGANNIFPGTGVAGTTFTIGTNGKLVDSYDEDPEHVALFIDHEPCTVEQFGTTSIKGTVPAGLSLGAHDVVVQSTTGQVGVAVGVFTIVAPPRVLSIDPAVGSNAGQYPVTITGEGFDKLPAPSLVINSLDSNNLLPVTVQPGRTDTSLTFLMPTVGYTGAVTFGVMDHDSEVGAMLPINSFTFTNAPAIQRLVPNLTTILGGDTIIVTGTGYSASDHVYLERTPASGSFEELFGTFVSDSRHQFVAPVRAKGVYRVYVTDQFGQPLPLRYRDLYYYQFTNLATAVAGAFPSGADQWDGYTTAVADYDKDGYDDIFVARRGGTSAAATPNTRVLRNDAANNGGNPRFVDKTTTAFPTVASGEDWRADRIWASDVDEDGYPDLLLVSNDTSVLSGSRSHVRVVMNEVKATNDATRVFRDRTGELFPDPRSSTPLYGSGGGIVDNWRGLDMWVGDVDQTAGPPEIIITHQEKKEELDVSCSPYCSSPFSGGYTYGFYWGGSREFFWDKKANGGLGKYKFNRDFFPRKGGLRVPVVVPGTGQQLPICNSQYGSPCAGKFPPYLGKRIAVGSLDAAGAPDIVVVNDADVMFQKYDHATPPVLQTYTSAISVAINKFNSADGALVTDVTDRILLTGGDLKADAVEIGQIGYPDSNSYGTVVIARSSVVSAGTVLRLLKFKPPVVAANVADFEDITTGALPPPTTNDHWQASRIVFRDIDNDGDKDMILVCPAPPGGTDPAFRVLRNDIVGTTAGVLRESVRQLIVGDAASGVPSIISATEHFEGDAMSVGDVNKDGAYDFVITRAGTTSPAPQTRVLLVDKNN
jgi:hypothetical protein